MTCFSDECRKASPRAAPMAILSLVLHGNGSVVPLLKRWFSRLPLDMNSYTRSSSLSSPQ